MNNSSKVKTISAVIEIITEPETKELVLSVLKPELTQQNFSRSSVTIDSFDRGLHIKVRGTDLSSFRASVNSIMRLLNVISEMQKTISDTEDAKQGE
jgi:tRNA threonylcarbamoyladenosine modification (KEOPS) complex  Pcc1 subunit